MKPELRAALLDALWDAAVVIVCTALVLLYGCEPRRFSDECLATRDAAMIKLERSVQRYAEVSGGALDVIEESDTWTCDGAPDVTVTIDFDLIFWNGIQHKTGVLTMYRDFDTFQVEDLDE